jgi:CheY-like chemotaxis protein
MILDVAGAILKTLGYTVIAARTGADALAIYRSRQAAIDLVHPRHGHAGHERRGGFFRTETSRSQVRVLLASGYSLNAQAERILDRGCSGFNPKAVHVRRYFLPGARHSGLSRRAPPPGICADTVAAFR